MRHQDPAPRAEDTATKAGYRATLFVGAGTFGWGAAGKLRLILDELPGIETVGISGAAGEPLVAPDALIDPDMPPARLAGELADRQVGAALVVGEPLVAERIMATDVPVLAVDSLPYLWTDQDPVPVDAHTYCAQMCLSIPRLAWATLRRVRRLHWVEAIVPPPRRSLGGGGVVVNVGGLRSPFMKDAADAYVEGVLPPVVEGLRAAGLTVTAICGNLAPGHVQRLRSMVGAEATVGPCPHDRFAQLLRRADLLVTSPGSTTLLQAHGAGLPVLLLPPQNQSQFFNADWFAADDAARVALGWPVQALDPATLAPLRPRGEETVVRAVYQAIERHASDDIVVAHLRTRTAELARAAVDFPVDRPHLNLLGSRGAHQVARAVRQLLLAPGVAPGVRTLTNNRR